METTLRTHSVPLTPLLKEYVERRLESAFGRLECYEVRVLVTLSDVNGPRGGEDIRCRVQVRMPHLEVVVEDQSDNPFQAAGSAIGRAGHSLTRRIERLQSRRRRLQRRTPELC